jgi:hypothetical protein
MKQLNLCLEPLEIIRTTERYEGRREWLNTIEGYGQMNLSMPLGDGFGITNKAITKKCFLNLNFNGFLAKSHV